MLGGPVDLLQLTPRLGDEALGAASGDAAAAALRLDRLGGRAHGGCARLGALSARRLLARGTLRAALGPGLLGHYRVSRCGVCLPHQRQNFENSTRSGSFRFDFWVW